MIYGKNKLTRKQILTEPVLLLAFGFGSGLAGRAPGTFGTLAAIPLYWLLVQGASWFYPAATLLVCLAGIGICGSAAERLGVHDHSGIVWDEIAGFLLTMAWVPFSWQAVIVGFLAFRFFDIIKPWPISYIDRVVEGGLGIMLDDVLAGLAAAAVLFLMDY